MNDVLYAVLNWNRDPRQVREIIKNLPCPAKNVLVCTNQIQAWNRIHFKGRLIEAVPSIAASKNKILDQLKGEKFCFIIEDDIKILRADAFKQYTSMLDEFDLNFMCYGYDNVNRVLDEKPNPCMIVNDGTGRELYFHRHVCSSVIALRVNKYLPRFDESLNCLETEFLAQDMFDTKNLPFNGFFFDINQSWKYFTRVDTPRVRDKNVHLIQKDIDTRKRKIALSSNADEVLRYIVEKTS